MSKDIRLPILEEDGYGYPEIIREFLENEFHKLNRGRKRLIIGQMFGRILFRTRNLTELANKLKADEIGRYNHKTLPIMESLIKVMQSRTREESETNILMHETLIATTSKVEEGWIAWEKPSKIKHTIYDTQDNRTMPIILENILNSGGENAIIMTYLALTGDYLTVGIEV